MKVCHFDQVCQIVIERRRLLKQIANITQLAGLGVTIDGAYQDAEIVDMVRPIVISQINARIRELETDLTAYGVRVP